MRTGKKTLNSERLFILEKRGCDEMGKRGRPKKFKDGQELVSLFEEFCADIIDSDYDRIPSQTEFCKWLRQRKNDTNRKTIYNALNEYFPTIKKDFERLQSDLIAQGGMLGKYRNTMSIFVLKNWCRWADKPQEESENVNDRIAKSIEHLTEIISTPVKERKVEDFE